MNTRPLSPHLGVYKLGYTMLLSGLHRITGCAATVGFLCFAWWLMALASGQAAYANTMKILSSPLGRLVLFGFAFSVVYHLCNGIRHMMWDTGRGLERAQARRSGAVVVVVVLLIMALLVWMGCTALSRGAP
jgi:succinate dehydrogenase / fumarate reductase cytochrome b subunit